LLNGEQIRRSWISAEVGQKCDIGTAHFVQLYSAECWI